MLIPEESTMVMAQPHFLLFCDASGNATSSSVGRRQQACEFDPVSGRWKFTLEQLDGNRRLEVADCEEHSNPERLALMSVVRGLEALEQPSKVTLVTTSKYVSRGLRYGLSSWRERDYMWERFGVQMPIRNADLWQRVDGAMRFHGVTCRLIQAGGSLVNAELRESEQRPVGQPSVDDERAAIPASELVAVTSEMTVGEGQADVGDWRRSQALSGRDIRSTSFSDNWWQLAVGWIRWWRERLRSGDRMILGT
jgi:ribonuclease HI